MKKARIYFSLLVSAIALILAILDWLNIQPKKEEGTKQAVRNPKGNIDSLEKAREAKAEKAKKMDSIDHFIDLEQLT